MPYSDSKLAHASIKKGSGVKAAKSCIVAVSALPLLAAPVPVMAQAEHNIEADWKAAAEAQALRPTFVRDVDHVDPPLSLHEVNDRNASEGERDAQIWMRELQRPCDGSTDKPAVCLTILGPQDRPLGTPVTVKIDWRNLPDDAGLALTLANAAPAELRWHYVGLTGPILLSPLPLSGDGSQTLEWAGTAIGCDPTDFPRWCEGVATGRYILRATLYDTSKFSFLGYSRPTPADRAKRVLAQAESSAFTLSGTHDLNLLLRQSSRHLARQLAYRGFRTTDYVQSLLEHHATNPIAWGPQQSCTTLELLPPLAGQMDACIPTVLIDRNGLRARPDDVTYWGTFGFADGVLPQENAEIAARRAVIDRYGGQTDVIGYPYDLPPQADGIKAPIPSWRSIGVREVSYLPENGGRWLFSMDANLQAADNGDITQNEVFVRVAQDGTACMMQQRDSETCL